MKNNKLFNKVFSGLLIGGLLLGGGSMAMADSAASGTTNQAGTPPQMHGPRMDGMQKGGPEGLQSMVDELLSDGTITQAQADAITAKDAELDADRQAKIEAMKAERDAQKEAMKDMTAAERQAKMEALRAEREATQEQNKGDRVDLFTQLVNDGVFTSAEVDNLKEAIKTNMDEQRQAALISELTALVENNTITSDQSTAIQSALNESAAKRQAEMEATKDMTQEERDAYRQENPTERVSPLAALVEDGTITQAQANSVMKALPHPQGPNPQRGPQGPRGR